MDMKLETEMWPIKKIRPCERNRREIPQRAIDKVAASIQELGSRQPIAVDQACVIVAGTARYLAAKKLDPAEVPVHGLFSTSPSGGKNNG